jgi:hypothetical protein
LAGPVGCRSRPRLKTSEKQGCIANGGCWSTRSLHIVTTIRKRLFAGKVLLLEQDRRYLHFGVATDPPSRLMGHVAVSLQTLEQEILICRSTVLGVRNVQDYRPGFGPRSFRFRIGHGR